MKIAIIGCGVMGSAFAKAWAKEHQVFLIGRDQSKLKALSLSLSAPVVTLEEGCKAADVIMLGFKPKDLKDASSQIAPFLSSDKIVISILTGADSALLSSYLPKAKIVRTMPNLALTISQGIIGVAELQDKELKKQIQDLLSPLGLVYFLPESKMEGFTALCGSSPAFAFVILEAMIEAGVSLGFSFNDAKELVFKVFEGSIGLLKELKMHPDELKMQISSPGGTTIAGLREMEKQGVASGIIETMFACYHKAVEMKKQV